MDGIAVHFGLLDEKASSELASLFTEMELVAGGILFDYADSAEQCYLLIDGHLAVHKKTGFLDKMQVVALLDSGAIVGEGAFLHQHQRNTRVSAIEDSKLLSLSKTDFKQFKEKFPKSANQILEYIFSIVSLRLEKTTERLAHIL